MLKNKLLSAKRALLTRGIKTIAPYMLMATPIAVAASCEKEPTENPNAKRIEQLTALEKTQAKDLRAAFKDAFNSATYESGFNSRNTPEYLNCDKPAQNLLDSAYVSNMGNDGLREFFATGITCSPEFAALMTYYGHKI